MLTLSKKADYAIIAIAGLAAAGEAGASSRELAERFSLPLPLLRNLLKRLGQAGFVASTRGSEGGYRIALPLEEFSVADLVQAVEGPWRLAACCGECGETLAGLPGGQAGTRPIRRGGGEERRLGEPCRLEGTCPVKRPVRRLHACLSTLLEQITLADLVEDRIPDRVALVRGADHDSRTTKQQMLELRTS